MIDGSVPVEHAAQFHFADASAPRTTISHHTLQNRQCSR
jgi:hypothetical protein